MRDLGSNSNNWDGVGINGSKKHLHVFSSKIALKPLVASTNSTYFTSYWNDQLLCLTVDMLLFLFMFIVLYFCSTVLKVLVAY